jgi:hypothetical protein
MTPEAATPEASGTPTPPPADCFTIGVLAGAINGDPTERFGSIGGHLHHAAVAQLHGLVDGQLYPTERGWDLWERYDLALLPAGRAYMWPPSRVADVLAELNGEV